MIILDSSVLIEVFRKKDKTDTLFYKLAHSNNSFGISAITHYEIGIGNQKVHHEYWEQLSANLTVIPFNQACSNTAIEIYQNLLKVNKMIDLADLLIGATALAYNYPLATLNLKHFERIKNLELLKKL
jgi:tRNA(fMet)-specific endonuclease VapC